VAHPYELTDVVDDEAFMEVALRAAERAVRYNEVPVGAVAVFEGRVIAEAHNQREGRRDPVAHAELLVLQEAARVLDRWRLTGVTVYVTLEPCPMCAGALVNSRIDRLVYAADDPRAGAVCSVFEILDEARLNHRVSTTRGILAESSAALLQSFFRSRRK
jgi:tRNA(adenine34) deaminase